MCWQCDHPASTDADYLAMVAGLIHEHGWAVQFVEPSARIAPFAYTAGLARYARPELLVTGMEKRDAARVLNGLAAHLLHAEPPAPGERLALRGVPRPLEVVEVDRPDAHMPVAAIFAGGPFRALQLVRQDSRGRWPWDAGFRCGRWPQPVLGHRAGSVPPPSL